MKELALVSGDVERLRETLTELHRQLEGAESIDPQLQAPLRGVLQDIQEALDLATSEGGAPGHERSLSGRLSDMALEFETSHPTIAGTLNRLTHMLSSMGI